MTAAWKVNLVYGVMNHWSYVVILIAFCKYDTAVNIGWGCLEGGCWGEKEEEMAWG
jgi:hypothetical protein